MKILFLLTFLGSLISCKPKDQSGEVKNSYVPNLTENKKKQIKTNFDEIVNIMKTTKVVAHCYESFGNSNNIASEFKKSNLAFLNFYIDGSFYLKRNQSLGNQGLGPRSRLLYYDFSKDILAWKMTQVINEGSTGNSPVSFSIGYLKLNAGIETDSNSGELLIRNRKNLTGDGKGVSGQFDTEISNLLDAKHLSTKKVSDLNGLIFDFKNSVCIDFSNE